MEKTTTISREDAEDTIENLQFVIYDWKIYQLQFAPTAHHEDINKIIDQAKMMIEALKGDVIVIEA